MYKPFCNIKAPRGQKEITMEILNSNPTETGPVPVLGLASSVPGTGTPKASQSTDSTRSAGSGRNDASSPQAGGLGAGESAPTSVPAPVASIPEAIAAPVVTTAPAPVTNVKVEIPKTTGSTPGGWNRFAGYNRNDAMKKPKGRR